MPEQKSASDAARPDFDALFGYLVGFAEQMLRKHGEFYPFAARVTTAGALEAVAGQTETEKPASDAIITLLERAFQQEAAAGNVRAVGICYDARFGETPDTMRDAVCVRLEHTAGDALNVFVPYSKGWFGRLSLEEPIATPGTRRVFV